MNFHLSFRRQLLRLVQSVFFFELSRSSLKWPIAAIVRALSIVETWHFRVNNVGTQLKLVLLLGKLLHSGLFRPSTYASCFALTCAMLSIPGIITLCRLLWHRSFARGNFVSILENKGIVHLKLLFVFFEVLILHTNWARRSFVIVEYFLGFGQFLLLLLFNLS